VVDPAGCSEAAAELVLVWDEIYLVIPELIGIIVKELICDGPTGC